MFLDVLYLVNIEPCFRIDKKEIDFQEQKYYNEKINL